MVLATAIDLGCVSESPKGGEGDASRGSKPGQIVTADRGLIGKVKSVSPRSKFVLLNFPIGHLPEVDQFLTVYHKGLKVAELKVTGWQQDDLVVADILTGDAQEGDEVREK
jgi:hypothetical protein